MQAQELAKYFYMAIMLAVLTLAFFIFKPFLISLVCGGLIAYIFYPVYRALNRCIPSRKASAAIISFLIIVVSIVPAVLLLDAASKEAYGTYLLYKQKVAGKNLLSIDCREGFFCEKYNRANELLTSNPRVKLYFDNTVSNVSSFIINKVQKFVMAVPSIVLHLIITVIAAYYFFVDGEAVLRKVDRILPFKEHHKRTLTGRFGETCSALIYGQILIAVLEGALGAFGLYIFGISSPIMWGAVITILAIIPVVGASLVWVPASAFLVISGILSGSAILIWQGIGLFAYGLIFVSSVETLLKPYVIGGRAKMHPLIVLISVLGGIALFGGIGFFLGPLVVALFLAVLEIYESELRGVSK